MPENAWEQPEHMYNPRSNLYKSEVDKIQQKLERKNKPPINDFDKMTDMIDTEFGMLSNNSNTWNTNNSSSNSSTYRSSRLMSNESSESPMMAMGRGESSSLSRKIPNEFVPRSQQPRAVAQFKDARELEDPSRFSVQTKKPIPFKPEPYKINPVAPGMSRAGQPMPWG